jgi:uncharacterized protein YndB with AHSA1/START domain
MSEHTVALTRVFDAPRSRVFECWTRAEHLTHWFGPLGAVINSCETDPRPGGVFRLSIRFADGTALRVHGEFREVDAPSRLVIVCVADDLQGVEQMQEVIDVTFTEAQGRTTVALNARARGSETTSILKGMDQGWAQTVDRLGAHLKRR